MPPNRLPIVDSDDGVWGDILRQYLMQEHVNDDTDNPQNGGHKTITIQPGTAAAGTAPLKFSSGTLLTTPEAGAIEFLTDRLYFTQTTGTTRKTIATYNDASGAQGDIYYRDSGGNFTRLAVGSNGDILTVNSGVPAWTSTIAQSDVTDLETDLASKLDSTDFTSKASGGANFAISPDFEDTSVARTNYGSPVSPGYSTEQARSGTNSWKWTTPTLGSTSGIQFDLSDPNISTNVTARVQSGDKFYVSAWIYAHAGNNHASGGGVQLTARFVDSTGVLSHSYQNDTIALSSLPVSTWTKLHISLDVPAGYDRAVTFVTTSSSTPQGNIYYVDDLVWQSVSVYRQGAEIELFNTRDEETNYEKVRHRWDGGVYKIGTEQGGTGQVRDIMISSGGSTPSLALSNQNANKFDMVAGSGIPGASQLRLSGSLTGASGSQTGLNIIPTINQSSTAGYTALLVNPTHTTTGSGAKLLADFQLGGVSVASINTAGVITATAGTSAGNVVTIDGAQTLTNKTLTAPKLANGGYIADANSQVLLGAYTTASAVNFMTLANAATGGWPVLGATGTDTNVGMWFSPKGTGSLGIYAPSGQTAKLRAGGLDANHNLDLIPKGTGVVQANGIEVATISGTQNLTNKTLTNARLNTVHDTSGNTILGLSSNASAVNHIDIINAATGGSPYIRANGSDTNIHLMLAPKGTGDVYISVPSGEEASLRATGPDADHNLHLSSKGSGIVKINGLEAVTISGTQTLTNKTINASNNTLSNIAVSHFAASAIVTESEGIASNDNDTTIPTSAAVKDYVDSNPNNGETVTVSTSTSLTLDTNSSTWVFNGGSAGTWTLPAISGNTGARLTIRNRVNQDLFVQRGGSDQIWKISAINITTIKPQGTAVFVNDGTYWVYSSEVSVTDNEMVFISDSSSANYFTLDAGLLTGARTISMPDANTTLVGTGTVQTLTNKTLTSPRVNNILDTNGATILNFSATASADNYLTVANGNATWVGLQANGASTNIPIYMYPKGNGALVVYTSTGNTPTIQANGQDTNLNLNLTSKGTGTVQANGVDVVTTTGTQTLTNKTLSAPTVSGNPNFTGQPVMGDYAFTTSTLHLKGGSGGNAILQLSRGSGVTPSDTFDFALAGGGLSIRDVGAGGYLALNTFAASGSAELYVGQKYTVSDQSNRTGTLSATTHGSGAGNNIGGPNLIVQGGGGTGTGTPGDIQFKTFSTTTSGSTQQSSTVRATIAATTGVMTITNPGTVAGSVVSVDGAQTLTNKTINASNNTLTNITVSHMAASAIVTESEGIASNDNDTTIPTSAAVKDYADSAIGDLQDKFMTGTVATAAGTAAKTVTLDSPWSAVTPVSGDFLFITFTSGTTVSTPTLAVNGGSAYGIRTIQGQTSSTYINVEAGARILMFFDGTYYRPVAAPTNSAYSAISQAEITNTGSTTARLITGQRAEDLMVNEAAVARTLTNKTLTAPRVDTIYDTSGNQSIEIYAGTGDSRWQFRNSTTPTVYAVGAATNISMNIVPKGTGVVQAGGVEVVTVSGTQTLTNKTINASNNTLSNIAVSHMASSAIVTESEGIASNDNDTSIPTSAAVKDYVDNAGTSTFQDSAFTIQDNGDNTKQVKFEVSGVATGTTRTISVPNADFAMVGTSTAQTLTNKTINLSSNTLSGTIAQFNAALSDADFATAADLTSKADGTTVSGQGNAVTTEYRLVGTLPIDSSANYSSFMINGRIGGWTNANMAQWSIMVTNRSDYSGDNIMSAVICTGNVASATTLADIVIYKQVDKSALVYLKLDSYYAYDFTVKAYQATVSYTGGSVTPTGSQIWALSSANKLSADTNGNILGSVAPTANAHLTRKDYVDSGAATLSNKTLSSPRVNQINDTNGNTSLVFDATASAVNYLAIANKAAGAHPSIVARGTSSDIGITLTPKGAGNLTIYSDTGQTPRIVASGNDANHDLELRAKGTGVIKANNDGTDREIATISGTQTLTNKTLNASTITGTHTMTGAIDYTPTSGHLLTFGGTGVITRYAGGNNKSIGIGGDDTVIIGGGESKGMIASNVNLATETVEIGGENGVSIHVSTDNWASWANRKTTSFTGTGITWDGNQVWHAGNDGAGSGLDADTLDGQQASAFASASHTHVATDISNSTSVGRSVLTAADAAAARTAIGAGTGNGDVTLSGAQTLSNKSFSGPFYGNRSGVDVIRFNSDNNGAIDLGRQDNVASSPFIDFNSGATTTDFDARIQATGGTGSNGAGTLNITAGTFSHNTIPVVTTTATQTLTSKTLTNPRINTILDTNGSTILHFNPIASANNYLQITNNNGGWVGLSAVGASANIPIFLYPKGNGTVSIFGSSGETPTIEANGQDTNHNLTLRGKGTGLVEVTSNLYASKYATGAKLVAVDNIYTRTDYDSLIIGNNPATDVYQAGIKFVSRNGTSTTVGTRLIQNGDDFTIWAGSGTQNLAMTISSNGLVTTAGELRAGTAGTQSSSVVTNAGVQALTNKDMTSGTNTWPTFNQNTTGSAATLTTARTFRTNLSSTSTASFNGSANVTPGVQGTLGVGNGGTGATTLTGIVIGNGTSPFTTVAAPSGAIVGTTDVQTLTNKTISGSSNTITNLSASAITSGVLPRSVIGIQDFTNLVGGSDFDDGDSHPWNLGNGWSVVSDQAHSGTYSLKSLGTSNGTTTLQGDYEVKQSEVYFVEFWMRRDSAWNGSNGNSKLRIGDQGNSYIHAISFAAGDASADTWTKRSDTFTVPSGDTKITITLVSQDATAGTVWIDDIVIRRASFQDDALYLQDTTDNTKQVKFELSSVSSSSTRVITMPDTSLTLVGTDSSQALTNKDMTSGTNTWPTFNQSTTGNAATATALQNSRTFRTNLSSTSTASFNGTANVTPGVQGTLGVGNGGTGATTLTGLVVGNGTSPFTTVAAPSGAIVGTTDAQTLTNKTISGSSNTFSNIPTSAIAGLDTDFSKLVVDTQAGSTGTENGANTWAHIATFSTGTSQYSECQLILSVSTRQSARFDSAMVAVYFRSNSTSSNPAVGVEIIAHGGSGDMITSDSFKVVSDGWSSDMHLWFKKGNTYGAFSFYETSKSLNGGTLTYTSNPAWQSATPTGTVNNVSSDGLTAAGQTVWHAGNDGSGSGLDADLLDGMNTSSGAVGDTVMIRNSNADTTLRYLFSSHVNMSHSASTRSSDTVFYSSTDDYIRKNNATGFKTSLGLNNVDNTADASKSVLSAAQLTTARTIGGVSFNGTANINLPGVNIAGNQNTSGNAATATTSTYVTSGMPNNTDNYMNFRVIRNTNASTSNDGMYIGYGNTNSGDTRLYGGGQTSNPVTISSGGTVTATGTVQGTRIISTQSTGTAPFTVSSTTVVANLNADLLDGQHASAFASSSHTHVATNISDSTATGRSVLTAANAAAARSAIGAGTGDGDVTLSGVQTLTNKTVNDDSFAIQDNSDNSKKITFALEGMTTASTINLQAPNVTSGNHTIVVRNSTDVLKNKRIEPRTGTTASTSSLSINTDNYDAYSVTALAANITVNNPSGTPTAFEKFVLRIKDNGTPRSISWGSNWQGVGVSLPIVTTANKTLYIGAMYNDIDSKWDVVAVEQQA